MQQKTKNWTKELSNKIKLVKGDKDYSNPFPHFHIDNFLTRIF